MHLIEDHAAQAQIPVRFAASKVMEGDEKILERLKLTDNEKRILDEIARQTEEETGMDRAAAVAQMLKHTENNIAAFLIAPSIPTHELNLCSLIARSAPSIESNDTQISNALKSILLLNRIIISFIILIVLSYLVFCIKIRPISVLL